MRLPHVVLAMLAVALATAAWVMRPGQEPAAPASARAGACPLPARLATRVGQPPLQGSAPSSLQWSHADAQVQALASFSLQARVLGRRDYRNDRESRYAPLDLALGWGPMRQDSVLQQLAISQSGRWYHYRWQGDPPLAPAQIRDNSANMHLIPADAGVAAALARVRPDDQVALHGWLVQVQASDGWRWRSSLRRDDSGAGACEVVYVCAVDVAATR